MRISDYLSPAEIEEFLAPLRERFPDIATADETPDTAESVQADAVSDSNDNDE